MLDCFCTEHRADEPRQLSQHVISTLDDVIALARFFPLTKMRSGDREEHFWGVAGRMPQRLAPVGLAREALRDDLRVGFRPFSST